MFWSNSNAVLSSMETELNQGKLLIFRYYRNNRQLSSSLLQRLGLDNPAGEAMRALQAQDGNGEELRGLLAPDGQN